MKRLAYIILITGFFLGYASCKRQDSVYEEYLSNGELIVYPGKAIDAQAHPGRERIEISWINSPDPNVAKARIYWNNYTDTVQLDIPPDADTIRHIIEPLPEDTYSFMIVTYDDKGNASVPVEVMGAVYGSMYERSLSNRKLSNQATYDTDEEVLKLEWFVADDDVAGTWLYYTNAQNKNDSAWVDHSDIETQLDIKFGEPMFYKTVYQPGIDPFYTLKQRFWYTAGSVDLTESVGLKNTKQPFAYDEGIVVAARFAKAMDWEYNAVFSTRPWHVDLSQSLGAPRGVFALLFINDGNAGTDPIINGKLYQTVTLEAGSYEFVINRIFQTPGDLVEWEIYGAVAAGNDLPDVDNLDDALGYAGLCLVRTGGGARETPARIGIEFTVPVAGPVTLGFVVYFDENTPADQWGTRAIYFSSVALLQANPVY